MSTIKMSPNVSGTGAFTIAAPNSNTDRTLTLPDQTGTILTTATAGVPVSGPAFSAYGNAQSFANATWTKISCQNEEFDTNSCFDSTTNYRFTPTVAGYYQINAGIYFGFTIGSATVSIYKNGSEIKRGSANSGVTGGTLPVASILVYCNGATDYIEAYLYQNTGSSQSSNGGASLQYFQGSMVRSSV